MNTEVQFLIKVGRNAGILAGLYFVSVWASTSQLDFLNHIKTILIFMITYILTECGKRYGVSLKVPESKGKVCTMIL